MRRRLRRMTDAMLPFGVLLRRWRQNRRLSQEALALAAGSSTRHLSCLETARSQPSREMILRLASRLDVPLANRMAAHFAMGLAWLVVAGQAGRVHSCESPTCNDVFVDLSRNRSRRYCDSRTCGNRLHEIAAADS